MVYEETSGLYYDYNSGYYYDANKKMYYDGQKGVYLRFNYETNEYERLNSDNVVIENSSSSPSTISDNSDQSTIDDSHSDKKELQSNKVSEDTKLSDGELSSPSPPPKRKKSDKREKEKLKQERKRLKEELKIPCIRMVVLASSQETSSIMEGTYFIDLVIYHGCLHGKYIHIMKAL